MYNAKELIKSLPVIKMDDKILKCDAFVRSDTPNLLRVSSEHEYSQMFLDYYGEYEGGYPFIHQALKDWATDHNGFWEWENPSNIVFYLN